MAVGVGVVLAVLVGWYVLEAVISKGVDKGFDGVARAAHKAKGTKKPGGSKFVRSDDDQTREHQ